MSNFGYEDVAQQAWMLLDKQRDVYIQALKYYVTPESVVLDIGAGTGVWALFAAKLGAKHVYAVERSPMANLISVLAKENGLEDKITVLNKDARDIEKLPFTPDIVVGEMLGHFAPDENQHQLYRLAQRLVKDDAVFIPSKYTLHIGVVDSPELSYEFERLRSYEGISMDALVDKLQNRTKLGAHTPGMLLTEEVACLTLSSTDPLPNGFHGKTTVTRSGTANALVASFDAELAPGIHIRTAATEPMTHWEQAVFPLTPVVNLEKGEEVSFSILPRMVQNRDSYQWSICAGEKKAGGDAMLSVVGDKYAMMKQMGFQIKREPKLEVSRGLKHWATILGGGLDSIEAMSMRLFEAHGDDFTELKEAENEVLDLLHQCGALDR